MNNTFVWADLSTYNVAHSQSFYRGVFGWQFHDVSGYFIASQGSTEVVGIFETPAFFQKIKMPHFWMSYFAVHDALEVAERAREFRDAKVELTDQFYGGNIALIRDPQGAGFTVYDGGKLNSRSGRAGCLAWNELHVSSSERVIPFYERLFGWTAAGGASSGTFRLTNSSGEHVADILVLPNSVKGEHEYWVCTFTVADMSKTKQAIINHGGGVISDEGQRAMMYDNSHEAFFYVQSIS